MKLKDKVCIVTGGAMGNGLGIVILQCQNGCCSLGRKREKEQTKVIIGGN